MPVSRSEAESLKAMLDSPGWAVLSREYAQHLEANRVALENPALDHDKTQALRGGIAAGRLLVDLPARLIQMAPPDEDGDEPVARKTIKDYRKK